MSGLPSDKLPSGRVPAGSFPANGSSSEALPSGEFPSNGFRKEERLCGKASLSALVADGRWGTTAHLKYCWLRSREDGVVRVAVSVSKKFFKRAVKRNLLKRRIREAYRTQKQLLPSCGIDLLLIWSGKELADYLTISSEVAAVLLRISKASAGVAAAVASEVPAEVGGSAVAEGRTAVAGLSSTPVSVGDSGIAEGSSAPMPDFESEGRP